MTDYQSVQDSGVREQQGTGAVRDTQEGKGRYDLISQHALRRLAVHYENGAKKYGDRNWEKGIKVSRCLSSALRHIGKYLMGMNDEDHLSAAAWNVFCVLHFEETNRRDLIDVGPNVFAAEKTVVTVEDQERLKSSLVESRCKNCGCLDTLLENGKCQTCRDYIKRCGVVH